MNVEQNILVLVDPTRDAHYALDRALHYLSGPQHKPNLHLFFIVDQDTKDTSASNPEMHVDQQKLADMVRPLRDAGIEYSAELSFSTEWDAAIIESAKRHNADTIFVSDYSALRRRRRLTDAKWALLRKAGCPVLLVRPGAKEKREVILAALNVISDDKDRKAMNARIVERGHLLAEHYGAEFHVVAAYNDSMDFPDRSKTLANTGVEQNRLHVTQGRAADVISEVADEIDADLVMIGTMTRKGLITAMRGMASEEVIRKLDEDVLAMN